MLTLTFLGIGSAFAKRNLHSNALVEAWSADPRRQRQPDDNLLIDLGGTGPLGLDGLRRLDGFEYLDRGGSINYSAIRNVFITHLHADHTGGLEELAILARRQRCDGGRPRLFVAADLAGPLWDSCLRGGLEPHPGRLSTLEDYFDVRALPRRDERTTAPLPLGSRFELTPIRTPHLSIARRLDWPSYGLILRDRSGGPSAFYSGDTQFDPQGFAAVFEEARLIFHEVQLHEEPAPVHTLLSELRTLPEAVRRKMILYHVGDEWDGPAFGFVTREFGGFAEPHRRYTVLP